MEELNKPTPNTSDSEASEAANENNEIFVSHTDLQPLSEGIAAIRAEIAQVIIGQEKLVKLILAAILADGHVLLEGFPGLAKTLVSKLTAKAIDTDFSRIQFTPDLMPSDVLGTSIFDVKESRFEFKKGPIFSNIVLIDEINRAPAKTQAALFEVMEERQVTVDGDKMTMNEPFIILATQNPIDMEGTYALPEAQLDRFIFKIKVGYPNLDEEVKILQLHQQNNDLKELKQVRPILTAAEIASFKTLVSTVRIEENLMKYIASIVQATRSHKDIFLGASPRASLALLKGSKAIAAMNGRDYVIPEDIHEIADSVLAHRVILTAEKEMEGSTTDQVILDVIRSIDIPR